MKRRDFLCSSATLSLSLTMPRLKAMSAMPDATPERLDKAVRLFLCGDVMTGRGIDQVLAHPGDPTLHESYMRSALGYVDIAEAANGAIPRPVAFDYIWGDALQVLRQRRPDLRLINLETSITASDDHWPGKGIHYRMHPDNVACLRAAGVDCCVLANNHVLDWGYTGLEETLTTLANSGIATAGAGADLAEARAPAVFDLPEKGRVLVLSVAHPSSGVPEAWAAGRAKPGVNFLKDLSNVSVEALVSQLRKVKRAGDVVVVSIHWGGNWGYRVWQTQQRFAHRLIDSGVVDVVHGHSSHHPRPIEVYRGRPILYGCGDFLNDYEGIHGHEEYRPDLTFMYFLELDATDGALFRLELVPLQIRRFTLQHASGVDRSWMVSTLNRESRHFGTRIADIPGEYPTVQV